MGLICLLIRTRSNTSSVEQPSSQQDSDTRACFPGHGSEFDSSYVGVLQDHYYRPYRGTITCCCGLDDRDDDGDWAPAADFISRCDYRGLDANQASENFERGCGKNMLDFIPKGEFPDAENKCWTLENFGHPNPEVLEAPPYTLPELSTTYCSSSGCTIDVTGRDTSKAMLMLSPYPLEEPRMIDRIKGCREVHGVEVSEIGLEMTYLRDLSFAMTDAQGGPVEVSVSYQGCYVDNWRRGLMSRVGMLTMQDCAYAAIKARYTMFSLQYPAGSSTDGVAECHIGDKGVLSDDGSTPYTKVDDSECKSEDWNPTFHDQEFTYNGAGWRNAVYNLVALDPSTEIKFTYRWLPELPAGETVHVQVLDTESCALSSVVSLEVSAEEGQ